MEAHELVDKILNDALSKKASDIYWLPEENSYSIRYRVNGNQQTIQSIPSDQGIQCVTRIKVLAHLLTYRTQVAQDGVIHDSAKFANAEFRIAVMPTIHGERITIRIMDQQNTPIYLENLNFQPEAELGLQQMLKATSGMIILTGPTGCGKTTTIYAMIRELLRDNQDPASIISIEDPVECQIPGISQVSLSRSNEEWDYKEALKSALRQDVKTLVIGEMRDKEIVKVALEAALTGHRIITTFHAGDIAAVYARILHLGFEPFLIASAITGVVSQRLVLTPDKSKRIPLVAYLNPDDNWKELIASNQGLGEFRRQVKTYKQADLVQVAQALADKSIIAAEEVCLL